MRIAALVLGVTVLLAAILGGVMWRNANRPAAGTIAPAIVRAAPAPSSARDLVAAAGTALEACPLPDPPSVPDSTRASLDEMKAARTAFAAYDAATNAYTQCVDSTIARTAKESAGGASESDLEALNTFGARVHNAAIDQEKAVVEQFNAQIRAYTAKHPT